MCIPDAYELDELLDAFQSDRPPATWRQGMNVITEQLMEIRSIVERIPKSRRRASEAIDRYRLKFAAAMVSLSRGVPVTESERKELRDAMLDYEVKPGRPWSERDRAIVLHYGLNGIDNEPDPDDLPPFPMWSRAWWGSVPDGPRRPIAHAARTERAGA